MKISSADDAINTSAENMENIEWKDFSSFKKAEYLMIHQPDCSFLVGRLDSDSKTFNCHKWILQSASPVFETMFNGHFQESNVSKEIQVTDTEPSTFKKFLDFVYYGHIENFNVMDMLTVRNLIYLGKKYMISALTDSCIETMKKNLDNAENSDLICIYEYAYLIEDKDLIEKCRKIIIGRKPKSDFKIPLDYNINRPEEKRHIARAVRSTNSVSNNLPFAMGQPILSSGFHFAGNANQSSSASVNPLGSFVLPNKSSEEKIENTDNFNPSSSKDGINIFSETVFGVNKGDITTCSYIYELSPPIFYEFQKALSGYISEVARFNMIEMYAKINGFISDVTDHAEKIPEHNSKSNNNNNDNKNNNFEEAGANGSTDNISIKNQILNTVPLQKEMLNMMLCSINFLRMSAKEFTRGPGKSNLLDMEEKYNILVGIINKN